MSGKQHVDFYKKVLLRKRLARWAVDGAAYVPFIGDGDLAVDRWADRQIFGADLDSGRVEFASNRLPTAEIRVADCDVWPFSGLQDVIAVADFDAYVDPYPSFKSFWHSDVPKADRLVMFFTDGSRQALMRSSSWTHPDGTKLPDSATLGERQRIFHFYLPKHIRPWFEEFIGPSWRVVELSKYLRGWMIYWGVAIERSDS